MLMRMKEARAAVAHALQTSELQLNDRRNAQAAAACTDHAASVLGSTLPYSNCQPAAVDLLYDKLITTELVHSSASSNTGRSMS